MNNLYFSPDSLRSPLKDRRNQSDTPKTNVINYTNRIKFYSLYLALQPSTPDRASRQEFETHVGVERGVRNYVIVG